MKSYFRKKEVWKLFAFLLVLALTPLRHTHAQTKRDVEEIRSLLQHFYKQHSLDLQCFTLKKGVTESERLRFFREIKSRDDYGIKRLDIYEERKQDYAYWKSFFSEFFVEDLAKMYAHFCQPSNKSSAYEMLRDYRFGLEDEYSQQFSEFIFLNITFRELRQEQEGFAQYLMVHLRKRKPLLMRYVMKKQNSKWRILNYGNWTSAPDAEQSMTNFSLRDEKAQDLEKIK